MKKFYLAAIAIMASVSINGTNNISMGDSIRIHPVRLGGYSQQPVTMYNEAYCDSWTMSVTYPQGLMVKLVAGVTPLDGMTVPYIDRYGQEQLYTCALNVSAAYATVGSTITANGYWDYNGNGEYDPYGTVKWTPGAHSMFEYNFYVDPSFRGGYVTFDGRITSGSDQRGAILQDVRFYQRCWVWVGYRRGDVTGNDRVNIDDVTTLTNYLLNGDDGSIDEFGIAAADMNGDGNVTIADVTSIINYLLNK